MWGRHDADAHTAATNSDADFLRRGRRGNADDGAANGDADFLI